VKSDRAGSREKHQGFERESPGVARAFTRSGKDDQLMILMLVIRLVFVGRLSALIVWTRKGQR
jgi:hypothetical protein